MSGSKSIKKRKVTIEQRFGSEVLKNPEVRKKIKETMKPKYGTESYFSAKGFRKKAELSFFLRKEAKN